MPPSTAENRVAQNRRYYLAKKANGYASMYARVARDYYDSHKDTLREKKRARQSFQRESLRLRSILL